MNEVGKCLRSDFRMEAKGCEILGKNREPVLLCMGLFSRFCVWAPAEYCPQGVEDARERTGGGARAASTRSPTHHALAPSRRLKIAAHLPGPAARPADPVARSGGEFC